MLLGILSEQTTDTIISALRILLSTQREDNMAEMKQTTRWNESDAEIVTGEETSRYSIIQAIFLRLLSLWPWLSLTTISIDHLDRLYNLCGLSRLL